MRRTPLPSIGDARAAIDRIIDRHMCAADPDLRFLSDEPLTAIEYVARYGEDPDPDRCPPARLHPAVIADDVPDALLALDRLERDLAVRLRRARLHLIRAGQRNGMGPTALAAALRDRHRQNVAAHVRRLVAFLAGYPASYAGWQRYLDDQTRQVRAAGGVDQAERLARRLLDLWHLVPTDPGPSGLVPADWRDELVAELPGGEYATPAGLVGVLRGLARELARHQGLDPELRALVDQAAKALPLA